MFLTHTFPNIKATAILKTHSDVPSHFGSEPFRRMIISAHNHSVHDYFGQRAYRPGGSIVALRPLGPRANMQCRIDVPGDATVEMF